jgi:uncharacterized protein YjbI with pentapeptide repeats
MPDEHDDTTAFRGAQFTGMDFTGATFRDCDLRRVKIVDSWLVDVNVSGLIGRTPVVGPLAMRVWLGWSASAERTQRG